MRKFLSGVAVTALSVFTLIRPAPTRASVLFEPYAGYGGGTLTLTPVSGTALNHSMKGVTYGARLGLAFPLVFFAADYEITSGDIDGNGMNNGFTQNQLYGLAGVKIPFFRAYLGYGFMNELKSQMSSGERSFSGSALKGGLSFTGFPFIALNLEYIMSTYDHYKAPGIDQGIGGATYSQGKSDQVLLSLSLPFDF